MGECHYHRKKQRRKAACVICLLVTILLVILLLILYFAVFKPKDPSVQVPLMQMLAFNAVGTPPNVTAISFALNLEISIYNPNRGTFYVDQQTSSASLYYGSSQLGFAFLPNQNALIPSQSPLSYGVSVQTQHPIFLNLSAPYIYTTYPNTIVPLPISSIVTIFGHVTTLGSLSRHSAVASVCNITLGLASFKGTILSYSCKKSYSLDG